MEKDAKCKAANQGVATALVNRAWKMEDKKLSPRKTSRTLPWLDSKNSAAVSTSSVARKTRTSHPLQPRSDTTTHANRLQKSLPTPTQSPRNPRKHALRTNTTLRVVGSTPSLRYGSPKPSIKYRVSSIGGNMPTSKDKNKVPQTDGGSAPPASPPLSNAVSPTDTVRPRKESKPSIPPENLFVGVDSRNNGLAPVRSHFERSSSPGSICRPLQRNAKIADQPEITKSSQLSPTQHVPKRKRFETSPYRQLSNAIEGLEVLLQEAVGIAEDTADREPVEEVYEIIEDATKAVRKASEVPAKHLMATGSPLVISSSSQGDSQFSSESLYSTEDSSAGRNRDLLVAPVQRNMRGGSVLPQVFVDQQRGSIAMDWAYNDRQPRFESLVTTSESSKSDSSDSVIQAPPSHGRTRNNLLLPPDPIHDVPKEQTKFLSRSSAPRNQSRGRTRQRKASFAEVEPRGNRHRRSSRSHGDSSKLRRHRHRSSSYSRFDAALEDEEGLHLRHRPQWKSDFRQDLSMRDQVHNHTLNLRRHHRRQPIARNWSTSRKRYTATIACINTALLGIIVGIYNHLMAPKAGEVPRIQYMLADEKHNVIVGNVVLYFGLAISTFLSWSLPLLHGRKPYILASLAIALPLQFPQAVVISARRSPKNPKFRIGLLVARASSGLVLGFANVNFITVLLDLFGASLQSQNPHQEFVVVNDVRRHGGGMGIWLGIWSWCWIGSLAVGFQIGAGVIESLSPDWGFYIVVIILASALFLNVLTPETRRSTYRKSVTEVYNRDENFITRRVSRGEVKLHMCTEGPKYWFEEMWAAMRLTVMMMCQAGFSVLAFYLGWIYAQIVLVIVLLGALLSRDYKWKPQYVGLGVLSIAIGALCAVPLTKAGIFSRERKNPFRTDSMTFQKQITWSSHLVRRIIFTMVLPLMGLAYTISSAGRPKPYMVPITFAGAVGFLSLLAIAECHGLIMETFDTCDLQPGVNTRHRLQSLAVQDRRRRTDYSSFPRVTAGIFASQTIAYIGAAVATEVGGMMTRHLGAQASTGVTAGILLGLTILLTAVLWRFKEIQVIPSHTFGTRRDTKAWQELKELERGKSDWKAVVIGTPSGKMRRMSVLEMGGLSRWTEIRKLNFLIRGEKSRFS